VPLAMEGSQGNALEFAELGLECEPFLGVHFPEHMGTLSKLLCGFYMMAPIIFTVYEVCRLLWGMQRGWPTEDYPTERWSKEDRRMIGRLVRASKIILFFLFVHVFCFIENLLFRGLHDTTGLFFLTTDVRVCQELHLTFPSFTATYSIALIAVLKVDSDFALSIRYLVWENVYSQELVERLGYVQIGMEAFFKRSLVLMLTLIPPPVAVLALGNAGFADALVGVLQGVVLGIGYHSAWMKFFQMEGAGGHLDKLETRVFIPMLHKFRWLLDHLESICSCLPKTGRRSDPEQPLLEKSESQNIAVESALQSMKEIDVVTKKTFPGLEFLNIRLDSIINECIDSFGGMKEAQDGLTKKNHDKQRELEEKIHELENVKMKEFEEQKQAMIERFDLERLKLNEDLEKQRREQELQQKQLEDEKIAMQEEHSQTLAKNRERANTQYKELEELQLGNIKKLEIEREKQERLFEEEKKAMNDSFEDEKRKHKEELDQQSAFSRNLVQSSETLTQMTQAIEEGKWKLMNEKFEELTKKQEIMEQGGANKELKKMLSSITPIFKGKLAEVEVKKVEWKRGLKAVVEALDKAEAAKEGDADLDKEMLPPLAQDLFRSLSEMIKKGLILEQADKAIEAGLKEAVEVAGEKPIGKRIESFLANRWQACVAKYRTEPTLGPKVKDLQDKIISKAIWSSRHDFGSFDFTDLETCCEAVDVVNKTFLEKAAEMIEDANKPISSLPGTLGQLFTMLYFLEFLEKENQEKCRREFSKKLLELKGEKGPGVKKISQWVEEVSKSYTDDAALLQGADLEDVINKDAMQVINAMCSDQRRDQCKPLGVLYNIFCSLAKAWQQKFDVLAVPHHTQVFALLVFEKFLEAADPNVQTLIGQVGTGEGKSMLIAELAALCAMRGKKVHVVGTDSKLVLRDYESFRELFKMLNLHSLVCSDRDDLEENDISKSITDEADIVYCEPKHVESFYAGKARRGELGSTVYQNRVLILDEVDALVVDQAPSQQFVYDISWREIPLANGDQTTISEYVSALLNYLIKEGVDKNEDDLPAHIRPPAPVAEGAQPTEQRQIFDEARGLLKGVIEWDKKPTEEFRIFEGDFKLENGVNLKGKFVHMINKMPRTDANSNFCEVLRLHEACKNLADYPMRWFQKLFVMSKPRVFRQYQNIMGFSGTIGNEKEQRFFRDSYGAEFFLVPPFLSTCVDKADPTKELFHTANWAARESVGLMYDGILEGRTQGPLVVVKDTTKQYDCVKGLAQKARQNVPVLIIAKDTSQCEDFVKRLRREIGAFADDAIRSLSQNDYDRNPSLYKESLKKSTKAMGAKGKTIYRITVTDPSGARGTDYQMRDEEPDRLGGLMLIVLHIPLSERDWVQYKGRTARQKWRGQYCAVLQAPDYVELEAFAHDKGYEIDKALPQKVYDNLDKGDAWVANSKGEADEVVKQILDFGGEEAEANLKKTRAVYNSGFIANEVCEKVWMIWKDSKENENGVVNVDIKLRAAGRDAFLDICNRYRYLSADGIQEKVTKIRDNRTGIDYNVKNTRAPNPNYIPEDPPKDVKKKKAVLFVMDISFSMNQGDPPKLDTCKASMKTLMTSKGFLGKEDFIGVVAFGKGKKELLGLQRADYVEAGSTHLEKVSQLADGTAFEDAMGKVEIKESLGLSTYMYQTMHELIDPFMAKDLHDPEDDDDEEISKCIVLLCDGGDSSRGTFDYEKAKRVMSNAGDRLTLIIITVGNDRSLVQATAKMKEFIALGSSSSALFHADEDPQAIANAFKQVQAALTFADVGIVEAN